MNIRRKLERLEVRARAEICRACRGLGGRRILVEWPGEPVDVAQASACPACGQSVPADEVLIIDVSGVLNLGLSPAELELAKARITGVLPLSSSRGRVSHAPSTPRAHAARGSA